METRRRENGQKKEESKGRINSFKLREKKCKKENQERLDDELKKERKKEVQHTDSS